ncbi:MAG: hypothetical protein GXP62_20830 [Oligoflexia bacterium]|nr:hypothetical protein [Oligoflexia bacterium]
MSKSQRTPWWGELTLEVDQLAAWQLGPLTLWLRRRPHSWRVTEDRDLTQRSGPARRITSPQASDTAPHLHRVVTRYGLAETRPRVRLTPILAPRSVVCQPEIPFILPPNAVVQAFLSTPIWVRIDTAEDGFSHQADIHQPSGSWFGPNTWQGELCYAARTHLRVHRADLAHSATQAVTPVSLSNQGEYPLTIRQVKLPVPMLDLAESADGCLWTQPVTLGSQPTGMVAIDIDPLPDDLQPRLLSPARMPRPERGLMSAITHVFR